MVRGKKTERSLHRDGHRTGEGRQREREIVKGSAARSKVVVVTWSVAKARDSGQRAQKIHRYPKNKTGRRGNRKAKTSKMPILEPEIELAPARWQTKRKCAQTTGATGISLVERATLGVPL